jgi:hypothetical protein
MDDRKRLPLLAVVTGNLMDVGSFESAAAGNGYRFEAVKADALAGLRPLVAFVDLETAGADDAIGALVARGARVIAYGPHVDDLAMTRARSLGATMAEPRSRLLRDPSAYLPPLV